MLISEESLYEYYSRGFAIADPHFILIEKLLDKIARISYNTIDPNRSLSCNNHLSYQIGRS